MTSLSASELETNRPTAAMEVSHLSKTFHAGNALLRRDVHAVIDVSFRLEPGTTLALVGESGSGKTTVSRMVMGLERPTSGTIEILGEPRPSRMSRAAAVAYAKKIQMVFQNPARSLDPLQSIGDAISELLALHFTMTRTERRQRTEELLDLVKLSPRTYDSYPEHLSGGQQQRACIARALAARPRVIVLDEAVSALDVSVQAQVLNVLADVRDEVGVSYLFVTHDLSVVRQIADEVVVMRAGEIVERGTADDVLGAPQHPYTRVLRDSVPRPGWKPVRRA